MSAKLNSVIVIAVLFHALFAAALPAVADIVTFTAQGSIAVVNQGGQSGTSIGSAGQISIGDTFTALFSYDTASAGLDLNPNVAQGLFLISAGANNLVSFNIDGLPFQSSNAAGLVVQVFDNTVSELSNNTDLLAAQSNSVILPNQWSAAQASATIGIVDANGVALPNDTLPNTISPLFSQGLIQLSFSQGATVNGSFIDQLFIEGRFNISQIPEPTSGFLFFLILTMVVARWVYANIWKPCVGFRISKSQS